MVVIADESWHVPRMPLKVNVYSGTFLNLINCSSILGLLMNCEAAPVVFAILPIHIAYFKLKGHWTHLTIPSIGEMVV